MHTRLPFVPALVVVLLAASAARADEEGPGEEEGAKGEQQPLEVGPVGGDGEDDEQGGEDASSSDDAERDDDEASDHDPEELEIPSVHVIGERPEQLENVPGSAHVVTEEDMEATSPTDLNEMLRTVPGVNIDDEEGFSLRQNIGIRGLDPGRSRAVLMLEDGVPIATMPYGGPDLYYTPPKERIDSIEIVKGSGSVMHGPQTIGGVVNYLTPEPPEDLTVEVEGRYGSFDYGMARLRVGDTIGDDVGYLLQASHTRYGGYRSLDLQMTDLLGKLEVGLDGGDSINVKLNFYNENSDSTYVGLTTPQYEADPSLQPAVHDELPLWRVGGHARHKALFGSDLMLTTTVYGQYIERNWQRQNFGRRAQSPSGVDPDDYYERIINGSGETVSFDELPTEQRSNGAALFFEDATHNNNREFLFGGLQGRVRWDTEIGSVGSELTAGYRLHYERGHVARIRGDHARAAAGEARNDEIREGQALSLFAHETLSLLDDRLRISPGLRAELYWNERTVRRFNFETPEPETKADTFIAGIIPGIGVSFDATERLTVFGGIHRGFAPPRIQDAITSEGRDIQLDAEFSWNYELGFRANVADWFHTDLTGFFLDFSNQIIEPTLAGGAVSGDKPGTGSGEGQAAGLQNQGSTTHLGVESATTFDPARLADWGFQLPLSLSYTYVEATFDDGWTQKLEGFEMPYAPNHMLTATIGFEHPIGFEGQLRANYESEQFTDKIETPFPSLDGLRGPIGPRLLLDARLAYTWDAAGLTAYLKVRNLTDEEYISSRRPLGIKPGTPRRFIGGLQGRFP